MRSKIKALLRKWKALYIDLLDNAITEAFKLISSDDISVWFTETGYPISKT